MKTSPAGALRQLTRAKQEFSPESGGLKTELLRVLDRGQLNSAPAVLELHETLCFMRAYPGTAEVLAAVERMLARFERRSDLRRYRERLADTGIAGTEIRFPFFAPTAAWLAQQWGAQLSIDWSSQKNIDKLERLLPMLGLYCETLGLDEFGFEVREWINRMKRPEETDAAFLLRRLADTPMTPRVRESLFEELDMTLCLKAGTDTPARTREKYASSNTALQSVPLHRGRPDLRQELGRAPKSVRRLPRKEAIKIVGLARSAMVTRARDLDAFAYADPNDVTLIDCGDGLQITLNSMIPERRFLLESNLGYMLFRNGVPVGYGTYTALFNSAEVAYSVFDTFRSGEAAWMYARILAVARHVLGANAFTIDPYQLGEDNDDAIASGAWWFYQKLGFRPRDRELLRLMNRELRRMEAKPGYRSSTATLKKLVTANVFFQTGRPREDVLAVLPLANIGLKVTGYLAKRFGGERAQGERVCAQEAGKLLGVRSFRSFSPGEKLVWQRWSPLVMCLPGVDCWPAADRRALAALIKAKGGESEVDYVRRFDAHRRLRRALVDVAGAR